MPRRFSTAGAPELAAAAVVPGPTHFVVLEQYLKQGIHPEYMAAKVVCACGNRFETMSTQDELHVEICSVCHPFYTGKQRLVDTAGRVDRFKKKYEKTAQK